MKRHPFILGFLLLVLVFAGLVGWKAISLLVHLSHQSQYGRLHQSDFDIIVSPLATAGKPPVDCPPEYTNVLSNTNLFTPDEQKLLRTIPLQYGSRPANSGPAGSVLVHLDWFHNWLNSGRMRFQFTNSDMHDDMASASPALHYVRNKAGDGYDLHYWGGDVPKFLFAQYRHGLQNGLEVTMQGDHCEQWLRYSNGLAVDQWFMWDGSDGRKLDIWVKFKAPYPVSHSGLGFP